MQPKANKAPKPLGGSSLALRLEYIESSQQSSIEARFSTIPNDAGSSVLRWEIDKELKPGEGGFVRFDAKVR